MKLYFDNNMFRLGTCKCFEPTDPFSDDCLSYKALFEQIVQSDKTAAFAQSESNCIMLHVTVWCA